MARAVEAGAIIGKTPGDVVQRPQDTTLIDEVIARYEGVHRQRTAPASSARID